MTSDNLQLLRKQVATTARRLAAEGLLVGTAGNVSARLGDLVGVTGTGVVLEQCAPDDVSVVTMAGDLVGGTLVPSSETGLHLDLYAATATAAVVHTHAPWATAAACVLDELPVLHYQQILLGGTIRVAPYASFGSPELAGHVVRALEDRQAALMANHGSVAIGATLDKALENALLLEWLAALHHRATALGTPHVLDADQQEDVIVQAIRLGYGHTQEAVS